MRFKKTEHLFYKGFQMRRFFPFATILFGLIGAFQHAPVSAAELDVHDDPVMSCYLRMDGPPADGDAETLKALLRLYQDAGSEFPSVPRLCLSGATGDYAAVFDIISQLGGKFATAIPAGKTCAGPCALLFMAGRSGDGGTIDTQQGGRIVHPKGTLRFGEGGAPQMTIEQIGKVIAMQDAYDLPTEVIGAMIADAPDARTLTTVGEATRWQIRVAPSVIPDTLSPLSTWLACNNAASPLLPDLYLVDGQPYDPDYQRYETPEVDLSGNMQIGRVMLRVTSNAWVQCDVSVYGPSDLPTARVGTVGLTLGRDDGIKLYRAVYGPAFFTPETQISELARQSDTQAETVSVSAKSAPDRTDDRGLCGRIEAGKLVWHQICDRTVRVQPAEDMTSKTTTTFDIGNGTEITATGTGEYDRSWPEEMEPVHTFEERPAVYWGDGLPDAGDDGNDPGADEACRIVTDGQSQWCYTHFWRPESSEETFLFIAERDYESGMAYSQF